MKIISTVLFIAGLLVSFAAIWVPEKYVSKTIFTGLAMQLWSAVLKPEEAKP